MTYFKKQIILFLFQPLLTEQIIGALSYWPNMLMNWSDSREDGMNWFMLVTYLKAELTEFAEGLRSRVGMKKYGYG